MKSKINSDKNKDNNKDNKDKSLNQFVLGEKLGEGMFGKVRLGTHILTGEKVAIKLLEKMKILEQADKIRVEREIKILKQLKHNNIIQLYSVIQTSTTIYLIMEYSPGKELFEYIVSKRRLAESEALEFFQQILSGVDYMHKNRICHRDLKPENMLLDSNRNIKIIDFGLSNSYGKSDLLSTACGSPCYAAPEMIAGNKYQGIKIDTWSVGIILYAMVCGYLPFEDTNNDALYKKILEGKFAVPSFVSDSCKDLIKKILTVDPSKRISISQIREHPWFNTSTFYKAEGLLINSVVIPIDEEIVEKMVGMNFQKAETRCSVLSNKHNHITTTYYLLVKIKVKKNEPCISDLISSEYLNYINDKKNFLSNYDNDINIVVENLASSKGKFIDPERKEKKKKKNEENDYQENKKDVIETEKPIEIVTEKKLKIKEKDEECKVDYCTSDINSNIQLSKLDINNFNDDKKKLSTNDVNKKLKTQTTFTVDSSSSSNLESLDDKIERIRHRNAKSSKKVIHIVENIEKEIKDKKKDTNIDVNREKSKEKDKDEVKDVKIDNKSDLNKVKPIIPVIGGSTKNPLLGFGPSFGAKKTINKSNLIIADTFKEEEKSDLKESLTKNNNKREIDLKSSINSTKIDNSKNLLESLKKVDDEKDKQNEQDIKFNNKTKEEVKKKDENLSFNNNKQTQKEITSMNNDVKTESMLKKNTKDSSNAKVIKKENENIKDKKTNIVQTEPSIIKTTNTKKDEKQSVKDKQMNINSLNTKKTTEKERSTTVEKKINRNAKTNENEVSLNKQDLIKERSMMNKNTNESDKNNSNIKENLIRKNFSENKYNLKTRNQNQKVTKNYSVSNYKNAGLKNNLNNNNNNNINNSSDEKTNCFSNTNYITNIKRKFVGKKPYYSIDEGSFVSKEDMSKISDLKERINALKFNIKMPSVIDLVSPSKNKNNM